MTVGEKIQKHRKSLGLSQEELGSKLLVSRQTVSLWETDQTVPTIDNLKRLSAIFGVTVDVLLGEEDTAPAGAEPNEAYRFEYSEEEVRELSRLMWRPVLVRIGVLIFCFAFSVAEIVLDFTPSFVTGVYFGVAVFLTVLIWKWIVTNRKIVKASAEHLSNQVYVYGLYDDHFELDIFRGDEKICSSKFRYTEIEAVEVFENWLFLRLAGYAYVLRRKDLKENSAFWSYMYKNSAKTVGSQIPGRWKTASNLLFVASMASLPIALMLTELTSGPDAFTDNMWIFFVLTVLPIASLVCGIILNKKGFRTKKNIIVGAIMTAVLCLYGSFVILL